MQVSGSLQASTEAVLRRLRRGHARPRQATPGRHRATRLGVTTSSLGTPSTSRNSLVAAAMVNPPVTSHKRQRLDEEQRDALDNQARASTSQASTSSLAALAQPTKVFQCKRRAHAPTPPNVTDQDQVSLVAFPRLKDFEATENPRMVRQNAYRLALQHLDDQLDIAKQRLCLPLTESLIRWLDDPYLHSPPQAESSQAARRQDTLCVGSITSLTAEPDLFHLVSRQVHRSLSKARALWATASLAEVEASSTSSLIEGVVSQWLDCIGAPHADRGRGPTTLWNQLRSAVNAHREPQAGQGVSSSPLLVVVLPGLPSCPLFSSLHYLLNLPSSGQEPVLRIAVILANTQSPSGLATLDWQEKRCLDVETFYMPQWSPTELILDLCAPGQCTLPLPRSVLQAAAASFESSTSTGGDLKTVYEWIKTALMLHLTQNPRSILHPMITTRHLIDANQLRASDFTKCFWDEVRLEILAATHTHAKAEPDLSLLGVIDQKELQQIIDTDAEAAANDALLAYVVRSTEHARRAYRRVQIGLELIKTFPGLPASELDVTLSSLRQSLSNAVVTTDGTDASKKEAQHTIALLRQEVQGVLAPILRALRRNETETGGIPISQVEAWLDRIEDWALAAKETLRGGADSTVQPVDDTDRSRILQGVRALQQELSQSSAARRLQSSVDSSATTANADRVDAVSRQLKQEEALRDFRKHACDWFADEIRQLLVPQARLDLVEGSITSSLQLAVALESLLNPSPRSNVTLALARPELYLQHFSLSAHIALAEASVGAQEGYHEQPTSERLRLNRLNELLATKPHPQGQSSSTPRIQTDLSLAYSLLREAGGPGTGVKGRLINVYDWYQAWCIGASTDADASASSEKNGTSATGAAAAAVAPASKQTPGQQARFALALSTLALLGYIKRTRKGNGQAVLKVGGWDLVPGEEQEQRGDAGHKDDNVLVI